MEIFNENLAIFGPYQRHLVICQNVEYVQILGMNGHKKAKFWAEHWVFHIFCSLNFGQACKKIGTSQKFWYQGVKPNIFFRNLSPLICITIDVAFIAHFP